VHIHIEDNTTTWTCEREECEKYEINTPVLELFRMAGDWENETETCANILQTLGEDLPERDEEEEPTVIVIDEQITKPADSRFIKLPSSAKDYNIYEAVWSRLILVDKHREELKEKRGFIKEGWIDDCGFRSSIPNNHELVKDVLDLFPVNKLLESGIFYRREGSKKIDLANFMAGDGINKEGFAQNIQPVIIPYIDKNGRIIALRPHKANLTNKKFLEQENMVQYHKQLLNLVMPYGECFLSCKENSNQYTLVICEGEFKAAALAMLGIAAIAVPGISMMRNENFQRLLLAVIQRDDIKHLVIAFDREDKSHKEFKMRFEAKIYATYMALVLERYQFNCRVLDLPTEWMEGTPAKADWDGALAKFVRSAKTPELGLKKATEAFRTAITKAPPLAKQFDLFCSREGSIIQHRLNKLLHEPKVFLGGEKEAAMAAEITRHFPERYKSPYCNPDKVAEALRDCVGGYYVYKAPSEKQCDELGELKEKITADLEKIEEDNADDARKQKRQLYAVITCIKFADLME
jgi:Domain of unknown function (DUF3854)